MQEITIYTDGACSGNPGPGGWAAIIDFGDTETILNGGAAHTTNNQMELLAVINALEAVPHGKNVSVFTDSEYVQLGMAERITNWKRNGWRGVNKKPIKNLDLWMRLDDIAAGLKVTWQWVKGHSDNAINQRADLLARTALEKYRTT